MRIKFEKGMTPERIAELFVEHIRQNDIVIGSVNIYIQTYDEEMKAEPYGKYDDYFVCKPSKETRKEYEKDIVDIRRTRLKIANNNFPPRSLKVRLR